MSNYDKDRDLQLNQILQIVKIASLFFSAIAFFQYYFNGKDVYLLLTNDGLVFFSVLLTVLIIYILWT
ncbi:MAG TPA: diguanylate cyclase, partial [Candidatus Paceibacterota bacterium]